MCLQSKNVDVWHTQLLLIQYLLNAMRCEKNLTQNMTKVVLGMKDYYGSHQDMRQLKIQSSLWLQPPRKKKEAFHKPDVPYILSGEGKVRIMEILRNLKTPTGFVGAIHKCLSEGKLQYMKSHNYHIMMHQVNIKLRT